MIEVERSWSRKHQESISPPRQQLGLAEFLWCDYSSSLNIAGLNCISSVLSDLLPPHGLQHARLPCSPIPGACSNSCPSSRWCHPIIFPTVRVFSNESALCIRWPNYWSVLPVGLLKHGSSFSSKYCSTTQSTVDCVDVEVWIQRNQVYGGLTVKLYTDFQLCGGLASLTPALFRGQHLPVQGMQVQSLIVEPRSHMPYS